MEGIVLTVVATAAATVVSHQSSFLTETTQITEPVFCLYLFFYYIKFIYRYCNVISDLHFWVITDLSPVFLITPDIRSYFHPCSHDIAVLIPSSPFFLFCLLCPYGGYALNQLSQVFLSVVVSCSSPPSMTSYHHHHFPKPISKPTF